MWKSIRLSGNLLNVCEIYESVWECIKVYENVSNCLKMYKSVCKSLWVCVGCKNVCMKLYVKLCLWKCELIFVGECEQASIYMTKSMW